MDITVTFELLPFIDPLAHIARAGLPGLPQVERLRFTKDGGSPEVHLGASARLDGELIHSARRLSMGLIESSWDAGQLLAIELRSVLERLLSAVDSASTAKE